MLYIYRRRNSASARDLAEGVMVGGEGFRGLIARRTKGLALRTLTPNDQVVCLGEHFAAPPNVRTLNNVPIINKLVEAQRLTAARVATVEVSRARPNVAAVRAPLAEQFLQVGGGQLTIEQADLLSRQIAAFIQNQATRRRDWAAAPVVPAAEWLGRRNNHMGGADLLEGNIQDADYYSKKENLVEEYRLHMFKGKSIRAGKKVADPGRVPNPHQWIRSFDAGWTIRYDGFESTRPMRDIAAAALTALGLDFGAVDIGKRADNSLIVLEVNRAPGMEGGTIEAYAKSVVNWVRNHREIAE